MGECEPISSLMERDTECGAHHFPSPFLRGREREMGECEPISSLIEREIQSAEPIPSPSPFLRERERDGGG